MSAREKRSHKGSRSWSFIYAIVSIRNNKARSLGIALLLSIAMALPTAIFCWSSTTEYVAMEDILKEDPYQFTMFPEGHSGVEIESLQKAVETAMADPLIEVVDYYVSTAAIVSGLNNLTIPEWYYYGSNTVMPAYGVQDTRIIPMDNLKLSRIRSAFDWEGNDTIELGEVLISKGFAENIAELYNYNLQPGDLLSFDVIEPVVWKYGDNPIFFPEECRIENTNMLKVAGIYEPKSLSTSLADAFPSIMRSDPWAPPWLDMHEPVLGLSDSVIILEDELSEDTINRMKINTIFNPVALAQVSIRSILDWGIDDLSDGLEQTINRVAESNPDIHIRKSITLEEHSEFLTSITQSQSFTLLATPIILMSLFLTVFSSRTSIQEKAREIAILRSKGASFNQILSSAIWEAVLLSCIGFIAGLATVYIVVPFMGASDPFIIVDFQIFFRYMENFQFPLFALVIGATIIMFLPGLYMVHVNASVGIFEIGQPHTRSEIEAVQEFAVNRYIVSFFLLVLALLYLPDLIPPVGSLATLTVLSIALLLFAIAYVGSRLMQFILSKLAKAATSILGEKILYIIQSLKRRHGKFIPLLIILALTLTTTTMLMIENSSLESTIRNEIAYSYGADIRIEAPQNQLTFAFTIELEEYANVIEATSVIEVRSWISNYVFNLEGVKPTEFLRIGNFDPLGEDASEVRNTISLLNTKDDGIILSTYLQSLFNKSTGDPISFYVSSGDYNVFATFTILGFVDSAPGLGATHIQPGDRSVSIQLGHQVRPGGFALVNRDYLRELCNMDYARYFFAKARVDSSIDYFCRALEDRYNVEAGTPYVEYYPEEIASSLMFINGMRGFILIGISMCGVMMISAIVLFFGAAVKERRPEYAILRAVGASQKQVSSLVFGEFSGQIGAIIILSTVLGFLFGYVMSVIFFAMLPIALVVPGVVSVDPVAMALLSIAEWSLMFIACLYPARLASLTDMTEELRNL